MIVVDGSYGAITAVSRQPPRFRSRRAGPSRRPVRIVDQLDHVGPSDVPVITYGPTILASDRSADDVDPHARRVSDGRLPPSIKRDPADVVGRR